jgi:hypothetical protein
VNCDAVGVACALTAGAIHSEQAATPSRMNAIRLIAIPQL